MNPFYLRQVNCYQQPERSLVEAFRLLVSGVMVNPLPIAVYEGLWSLATYAVAERRAGFEAAFSLVNVYIDDVGFVLTLTPEWFIAYNDAVEAGEAPLDAPCPCDSF